MTKLDATTEAVLHANAQFYRALSLADFNLMQRLWVESADAVCVHPGWGPLYGWEAIRESWRGIFASQGPLHVWPSEAQVRVFGHTAEVTCFENIDTGQVAGTGVTQARATNVFRQVNGVWRLLEHHAVAAHTEPRPLEPFSEN